MSQLVTTAAEAIQNVERYLDELPQSRELQGIMSYARAWYAYRRHDGSWAVAPSKFVGYAGNSAGAYSRTHRERDGRLTERVLSRWFEEVTPGSALYQDIALAVSRLFAQFARTENARLRIAVLRSHLTLAAVDVPRQPASARTQVSRQRITMDPDVCGGRPVIRGMRIRVSDILDLLASGVERAEVLADYPYLEDEDITAALEYAARSVDHRIIRAA